jgi:hypothetical protein
MAPAYKTTHDLFSCHLKESHSMKILTQVFHCSRQFDLRVKLAASSRLRGSQHADSYVNDPSVYRTSDSSDMVVQNPYKLLVPTTVTPKVPLVLVAAFHLAQAPISQGERFLTSALHEHPGTSHAKVKYQKKRAHSTSKSSSDPSHAHSKKIRVDTAISQQNYPYKLISPVGPVPTPPVILLSSTTHSGIKKQRVKDNASRRQQIVPGTAVVVPKQHSDAHVSLKVIPHTKILKNPVEGDGVGGKEKIGVAVSKFRLTGSTAPELPKKPGTTASKNIANGKNNRRNVAWHPGMVSICGITYINPTIAAASLSQNSPPPVTIGNPIDRVTLMKPPKDLAPEFNAEDPVAGSVQYLKYLALLAGRLPPFAARVQHDWNVRQKVHRDRLERIARVRGDFPENPRQFLRRSSRAKGSMGELSNHPHSPLEAAQRQELKLGTAYSKEEGDRKPCFNSSVRIKVAPFDPADLTDVRLGVEFQAQPPPAARRPAFPRPEEARWVEGFIIHGERSQKYGQQASKDICKESSPERMSCEARQRLLEKKTTVLVNKLGQEAATSLGVGKMGLRMVSRLKEEEQDAFGKGMKSNDRDFNQISKSFLPDFQPRILAEYIEYI